VAVRGPDTFRRRRRRNSTVCSSSASVAAFVVPPLVPSQRLSRRKTLVTDRTLVRPTTARNGGRRRVPGGDGLVVGRGPGLFPVTGLVSSQGLVRSKRLVANATLVDQLRFSRNQRRRRCGGGGGGGGGAAASEHDEAESEVLFFSRLMRFHATGSFRSLSLGPGRWVSEGSDQVVVGESR